MSDDRERTIATATMTSEDKPYGARIDAGGHALRADEPAGQGGAGTGPPPFGLLLSGLGACTAITLHGVDDDQRAKLAEIAEKTPVTMAVRAGNTTTGVR